MKLPFTFLILSGSLISFPLFAETSADAEAWFFQAKTLLRGEGKTKDLEQAFELMKKAADAGNPEAVGGLGYFYSTGIGGAEQSDVLAERWFRKGAELGDAKAMYNLGKMLLSGRFKSENSEAEGLVWIRKAAEAGLPEALNEMGERYYHGDGVTKDYAEAYRWLLKAAKAGEANAQNAVGVMSAEGLGIARDSEAAEEWYRQAANAGNAKAQSNLAHLIGISNPDAGRRAEALQWLVMAADQKEVTAIKTLNALEATIAPEEWSLARRKAASLQLRIASAKRKQQ